jgi:hypothetical protein
VYKVSREYRVSWALVFKDFRVSRVFRVFQAFKVRPMA